MAIVSILNPAARTKEGKAQSAEIVDERELTPDLITKEGWSPVCFVGSRRLASDFREAHVVGFDVDEGMTLKEAIDAFGDCKHIIGTTTSHQVEKNGKPACDRFRIILFTSDPILTAADYKETLVKLAAELKIPFDQQAKDAARWFIPCKTLVSYNLRYGAFSMPVFTAVPERKLAFTSQAKTTTQKGKLSKATKDFLAQEDNGKEWHSRFIKAAMDFKEQGYTEDEAARRLQAASPDLELDATDLRQLSDVYINRGGALEFREAWPEMLPATEKSPSRPNPVSVANQRYLLSEVLGFTFHSNTRREVIYYVERDKGPERQLLNDATVARLNTGAREHRIAAGESIRDLITTLALENSFDPILDPLKALQWDGKEHIKALFETISLPADTDANAREWYHKFLRRWLIGVVTKVFYPGSENNVLVFQGEQAAGKSRWLKRLAELWPEGFGEGSISPDDKDHELRHLDNFIWHVAEFDSTTSRREVGALKDYFTKDTVNVRRPYSRLPIIGRSICSFCASVNSHEFLHDATGNRRYLVIPIVGLDASHKVDITQVMAEAKAAMEAGEKQWFSRDEIERVNALNQHFLSKEEYLEILEARAVPGLTLLTLTKILEKIGHEDLQLTRPIRSNIRTILERKGIQKKNKHGCTMFAIDDRALSGAKEVPELSVVETAKAKQIKS